MIFFVLAGLLVFSAWAVDIEERELEKTSGEIIEFFNYEGPHDKIETDEQIRSIGEGLSISIADGVDYSVVRRGSYFDKYRIIHIIAPQEQAGLNADIFIISDQARVDHIDNIRRILSGYVRESYGFSEERADALAKFITYYNAVYRSRMDYFRIAYNILVVGELDPEKAGIARRYSEWPGRTQMLIPLTRLAGAVLPAAETLGGDEAVVEELRTEKDRGIEERKEIVEMREEQLEEEIQELEEEKEALQQQEDELADTRDLESADQKQIEEKEEEIAGKKAEIERKEEELEERKDKIAEERERVSEDQKEIIAREEVRKAAVEEREAEQASPAAAPGEGTALIPFIVVEERENNPFGTLVLIDSEGEIKNRSKLNTIRSREIIINRDRLYVAAGDDAPPRAVRLVALDTGSLEVAAESDIDVFSGTALELADGFLFCVVREGKDYYLGRFNMNLELQQKSMLKVARFTSIYPTGSNIIVQRKDGHIVFLDRDTLLE